PPVRSDIKLVVQFSSLAGNREVRSPRVADNIFVFVIFPFAEFNGDEFVTLIGRAQLQSKVVEQFALVNGDNYLSLVLFRKDADQSCKLGNVHFIHGLDGIVEHQTWSHRLDNEVQCEEQGQGCGVEITSGEHHLGRATRFAGAVCRLQFDIERGLRGSRDAKTWNESFVWCEPGEYTAPNVVQGFGENTLH